MFMITSKSATPRHLLLWVWLMVILGKHLVLQNNQMGNLQNLRNPLKFPPSLPSLPLSLGDPTAQQPQDSGETCLFR